ncbi:hypothetical protein DFH27DRAFT_77952 [Peziza echinospora]|nr:hypothetical protein DFH27DRAFT_77952 [Peziza echinospora]
MHSCPTQLSVRLLIYLSTSIRRTLVAYLSCLLQMWCFGRTAAPHGHVPALPAGVVSLELARPVKRAPAPVKRPGRVLKLLPAPQTIPAARTEDAEPTDHRPHMAPKRKSVPGSPARETATFVLAHGTAGQDGRGRLQRAHGRRTCMAGLHNADAVAGRGLAAEAMPAS